MQLRELRESQNLTIEELYQFWINSALRGKVENLRSGGKVKRE